MAKKTETTTFLLELQLRKALERKAEKERRSMNYLVNEMLRQMLADELEQEGRNN